MRRKTQFYDGQPCRRCGSTKRYVSYRACVKCELLKAVQNKEAGIAAERTRRTYAKHTAKQKARVQKWKRENPGKTSENTANRRAAKRKRTPAWLTEDQRRQMRRMYEEAARRTRETGVKWQVDHIVPLLGNGVCGLHVPWNLQLLTGLENQKKGNKILAEAAHQSPD